LAFQNAASGFFDFLAHADFHRQIIRGPRTNHTNRRKFTAIGVANQTLQSDVDGSIAAANHDVVALPDFFGQKNVGFLDRARNRKAQITAKQSLTDFLFDEFLVDRPSLRVNKH
jgi:hypothetical protein